MKNEDELFNKMFKSLNKEIAPSKEVKEKIFESISCKSKQINFYYSLYHSWILEKFIKLSIPLSVLFIFFTRIEAS